MNTPAGGTSTIHEILSYRTDRAILHWSGRRMGASQVVRHVIAIAGVGLLAASIAATFAATSTGR